MASEKWVTADEALGHIKKGSRVFIGSGCGEPQFLVERLVQQAENFFDVEILHVLSIRDPGYSATGLSDRFRVQTFFVAGRGAREAVWEGRAEYIPIFISDIPRLFNDRRLEIDTALIQVSPPDKNGYMSLGIAVDVAKEAVEAAGTVIAQVNSAMPVTLGDGFIHVRDVDYLVDKEEPLLEVGKPPLSETDWAIGRNVARLVNDGATVHAGLGHLPATALLSLKDKKDLGIHTDMFTEAYLELIRSGAVTNNKKEINRKKAIASYCLGGRELFDFVHLNPLVEFHPVAYTNDPNVISRHESMVSIHEAMEVDFTGLVCASSGRNRIYSGIGGLVDFMRGTSRARRGKFIIVLHSLTRDGQSSCLVPGIPSGSGLIASRAAVQYVVTEFGSVNLQAKSLRDRTIALLEIAHPKFRQELSNRARDEGLLSHGEPITFSTPGIYPAELEKKVTYDYQELQLRPAKPTDLRSIQEFFYGLSDADVYYRFLRTVRSFPREEMAAIADIDYHYRMTILAITGELGFEKIAALGRYIAEPGQELAEVDIAVGREYRRLGIGLAIMRHLFEAAEKKGFRGIRAIVNYDNTGTIMLLKKMGYNLRATLSQGVYEIEMLFEEKSADPSFVVTYA
ncbi:MAG: GNAT family N-acetyltransferase [Deltaproteobacteria bacterium]|nr:GNAT family N-acetyltransferase [Deltaproteobacteria bacterium]